tara:strand:+ start:8510 stop:8833 length:324 start_codon:yes stop_codon:yes gene_type:complete
MITLTFIAPDGTEIPATANSGVSLMEAARAANVPGILAECGGACSCSTCHVYIEGDWPAKLPAIGEDEADLLDFAFEPDAQRSRLSCQIMLSDALDGLRARVPSQQG